jgi:DNA-binding transcriptional LysR family regulator
MDRFEAIRAFLAAVDGGSLSAASRRLEVPLPTLSRRVSDLEAHLGTQLLVRTSRKVLLTDAGRAFAVAGRRLLEDLGDAERAAAGEYQTPRGDLLVTASLMFGKRHLTPTVLEFLAAYPAVNVRVVLSDQVIDLVDAGVDVAVRIGALPDSGLVAQTVGQARWLICASPDYLARRGHPETPESLGQHDCIAFEGLQPYRTWPFGTGQQARMVDIRPRFSGNTADAVIDAANAGLGVARLMSYQAEPEIREGRLVRLLADFAPDPAPIHLVHTGPTLVPLKLRAFLDFVGPRLKARLKRLDDL